MARTRKTNTSDLEEKRLLFQQVAANIEIVPVEKFLQTNFLPYAWSMTLDRALTDVSGLKPVQRRIVYTMYKSGLNPNASRSKVATLAGKVLEFHPHGDASVADAIKNLGREHVFRVPLVDGRGDFGAPGAPGAAGRYLEARLSKAAWLNVAEISEKAVKIVPNYDNTTVEPVRLPVRWPVAVINGGSGMAVGYASNLPSHNPTEIMKACKLLVRNENTTHAALQKVILGPDYHMGGFITANDGIKEYLETGSGSFKIRGQYTVKPGPKNTYRIEFHEIPFGTSQEKILEAIQSSIEKGHFKEISVYKDLSDLKHPVRVIVETKSNTNYKKVLQDLFKLTPLETSVAANITTIVDGRPQKSSMKELLLDFINFRKECIVKKSAYSMEKKDARLHLIEGLHKVLLDIDAAIKIIRAAPTADEANTKLQRKFKIDEVQADYVLSLQLRRLTKMDTVELKNEKKTLVEEIAYLQKLMTDADVMKTHLLNEIDETTKIIGDERKTVVNDAATEDFVAAEKTVVKEVRQESKNIPCYVTRFVDGGILKTSEPFTYSDKLKKLSNSPIVEQIKMNTQDNIVVVDSTGNGHSVPLSFFPEGKVSDLRVAGISLAKNVRIVGISKLEAMKSDIGLAIGTKNGLVKVSKVDFPNNRESFPVITLSDGDEVVDARWLGRSVTNSLFSMVSSSGNILLFDASSVNPTGHKAGGVRGIKLKDEKDSVVHFGLVSDPKNSTLVTYSGVTIKQTHLSEILPKGRGSQGVATQLFKPGETAIKVASVGSGLVACSDRATRNLIALPPMVKRASRGVDFNMGVLLGFSEVQPM